MDKKRNQSIVFHFFFQVLELSDFPLVLLKFKYIFKSQRRKYYFSRFLWRLWLLAALSLCQMGRFSLGNIKKKKKKGNSTLLLRNPFGTKREREKNRKCLLVLKIPSSWGDKFKSTLSWSKTIQFCCQTPTTTKRKRDKEKTANKTLSAEFILGDILKARVPASPGTVLH